MKTTSVSSINYSSSESKAGGLNRLFSVAGSAHPLTHNLVYGIGGLAPMAGSVLKIKSGIQDLSKSRHIGDEEGEIKAKANIAAGSASFSMSTFFWAHTTFGSSIAGLGLAANVLSALLACIKIGTWGVLGYQSYAFGSALSKAMDNKEITESERLLEGIKFLQQKIAPTSEERKIIGAEIEKSYGSLSPETKECLQRRKLLDLTNAKIERLKRRMDIQLVRRIALDSDRLITRLQLSSDSFLAQKEARGFIRSVQKANQKRTMLYIAAAGIASIALGILITGIVFSMGLLTLGGSVLVAAGGFLIAVAPLIRKKKVGQEDLAKIAVNIGLENSLSFESKQNLSGVA